MVTRLRLVESFLIQDLDLQSRFHYAPRDSKSHPVERVMSALNEAAGDGRFITPSVKSLTVAYSEGELFSMTSDEVKQAEDKLQEAAAIECAKLVSARYEGTNCMGTSVHAHVSEPTDMYSHFFYDEEEMLNWHHASACQKASTAGSNYYSFLENKFETNYIRYDNGVEGIRMEGELRCPATVHRVPPPVPDLTTSKENRSWSYHTPETLPEQYRDVSDREADDFCPRVQIKKMIKDCGDVHLCMEEKEDDITFYDASQTWTKILSKLDEFVLTICGKDLEEVVTKYAEEVYLRGVKRAISKKTAVVKVPEKDLVSIKTGPLKVRIQKNKE